MNKTRFVVIAALTGLLLVALGAAGAYAGSNTETTRGDEVLEPNQRISSNLRFSPGQDALASGETMTWVHGDKTLAPHTVTLATADELVGNFDDFFGCEPCLAAIGAALAGHFPDEFTVVPVLDPDGDGLFDSPGDSMLFFPGQTISAQISNPAGEILYYFCAIHPWMQGTIEVN